MVIKIGFERRPAQLSETLRLPRIPRTKSKDETGKQGDANHQQPEYLDEYQRVHRV